MSHYYFLDDSGDPGLGGAEGSSSYLVFAMVKLADRASLPALVSVRRKLHLSSKVEFKYYRTRKSQKRTFFQSIQSLPFCVRAVMINKSELERPLTKMSGQELTIEFITHLTLRASELDIANDVLIIDGATKAFCRALRVRLSKECRQQKRVRPFKKIISF